MKREPLVVAAERLCGAVGGLVFKSPVTHVYNPLEYAWASYEQYLRKFGRGRRRVVLLGMNPGPWGMAQTGVPFGEVMAVRDWMGITAAVGRPSREHPKRPIEGFACERSEVSGRRMWGLFGRRYASAADFFKEHFVANYCPLVFMSATGANVTPDKLSGAVVERMEQACDAHLREVVGAMRPEWLIGVGGFAEAKAMQVREGMPSLRVGRILHPSPASPAANRDWAGEATRQLVQLGVW